MKTPTDSSPSSGLAQTSDSRHRFIVCAALAAFVFASRAWLAQVWGSVLPYWDEWDLEAIGLYRPWLDGTLHLSDLFKAHNEHHLLLTRLCDLGFFVFYGRWAPWAQIVLNAGLHAATAAALAALFWPALTAPARTGFVAGLALFFSATFGWQNALYGIQSQVYFASLLAVGALAGLTLAAPLTLRWWAGWTAAVLALFSLASGVLAAVAALTIALLFTRREGWRTLRHAVALGLVGAIVAFGLLRFTEPPAQAGLHAQSIAQFYSVFARCLGFPHVNSPVLWVLMQLPLLTLLVVRWRRRAPLSVVDRCALALLAFAVLQAAAVAHNRANGLVDLRPLSRYLDPLLLGVAAQLYAVLHLATTCGRAGRLLAIAWSAAAAVGLLTLTTANLTLNLPYKRAQDVAGLAQVRTYLLSGDATVFTRDPAFPAPHPDPKVIQRVLDDPVLRPVLPIAFSIDYPGSAGEPPPWVIFHGRTLTLAALATLGVALFWRGRQKSRAARV